MPASWCARSRSRPDRFGGIESGSPPPEEVGRVHCGGVRGGTYTGVTRGPVVWRTLASVLLVAGEADEPTFGAVLGLAATVVAGQVTFGVVRAGLAAVGVGVADRTASGWGATGLAATVRLG